MKKLAVVFSLFAIALTGKAFAQSAGKVSVKDISFVAEIKEGLNSMLIKEGKGTLQFMKKGDIISDVEIK